MKPARSPEVIEKQCTIVLAAIRKAGQKGITAEVLRERTGLGASELPLLFRRLVDSGGIERAGKARATRYYGR